MIAAIGRKACKQVDLLRRRRNKSGMPDEPIPVEEHCIVSREFLRGLHNDFDLAIKLVQLLTGENERLPMDTSALAVELSSRSYRHRDKLRSVIWPPRKQREDPLSPETPPPRPTILTRLGYFDADFVMMMRNIDRP